MRRAYKRIMPDQLLQTRVPKDVAKKVAAAAKDEGDTVAGWMRRLLIRHFAVGSVDAWSKPAKSVALDDGITTKSQPQFLLRHVRDTPAADRVFTVSDHLGAPVTAEVVRARGSSVFGNDRWWILRGSSLPWEVITQLVIGDTVEMTLRPVR